MWGLCIFITFLPIAQLYRCGGYNAIGLELLCNYNYLENSAFAFKQLAENKWLLAMSSITIFDIAFFNYFGITITKYASAAQRSTVDLLRILSVWVMSVILGLEKFNALQVPCLIILAAGFAIYNEIVSIPFGGLDQHTEAGIKRRYNERNKVVLSASDSLFNITKYS
jgi:hypothetical protein